MRKLMMPLTLMLVVLLIALFMAAATYSAVMQSDAVPSARGLGLTLVFGFTTIGCLATLCWVFVGYDLVPREWDSNMREAKRAGKIDEAFFVKGGMIHADGYSMNRHDERNRLLFSAAPGSLKSNTIDLGPRPLRQIAVVSQGRVLMSADLGTDPTAGLDFIVFEDERVYKFDWRNANGIYWLRR